MAKNDVKQLNYTVDEINSGLQTAFEVGSEEKGLTLKYIDEKTLRIYNTHGSKNEEDWTPVGDEVMIISADPDAVSYKFDFTPVSPTEPQIFVKESVDKDIQNTQWQIQYKIKQIDNKGNTLFDPVEVTWTVKVNNNTRTFKETINYTVSNLDETRSFNWINAIYKDANFYGVGEYTIQARFVGVDNIVANRTWRVSLTSLTFTSAFSEEKIYRESEFTIPYEVQGNMSKTISCKLVNKSTLEEIKLNPIQHIASTYKQTGNFTVSNLTHGTYIVLLGCEGLSGTTTVTAPSIYKEFIFAQEGNNTPLIRWSYSEDSSLQQYVRTEFKYGIYNPSNTLSDITIDLFSENNNTNQTRTIVPDNSTYIWYYYPTKDSTVNGVLSKQTFSISTKDLENNISIEKKLIVEPFAGADKIMEIEGVSFDFNPVGRTNYDLNRNEYVFKNKNYLTVSENFDWANGGWIQENIGTAENPQIVDAFLIKAGSSITLDYNLFEAARSGESLNDMTLKSGKNMKFIFKTTNCQRMTAPIMVCKGDNNTGLIINSQNAEIYYRPDASQAAINLPYVEEEVVELEYNIESETHGRKPLLVSYLSSDPSQAVTCELTPTGQPGQWTQDTPEKIVFGSDYCDTYLYRIKVYDRELSDAEIMQNYYADAFDGNIAYQRYVDNDILLDNGDIDIEKLKQKYPELRILLIDCKDVWSNGKKDYREAYVEHHYPNGRLKDNWKANAGISIQGTSSVEYLTSAGNFDIDLKCKKIENPREVGMKYLFEGEYYTKDELVGNPKIDAAEIEELLKTEYAMTDNSIPVNYINVKANVASSENANNARLAEWFHNYNSYKRRARRYNEKIRDTMEFHPCVVFIRENAGLDNREFDNDGNYHFYICGDFGNSKKNNNAFGMGEEAAYIVNELIANGEIDEAHREEKVAEYQAKECIVEVSNNIHDICRFKTAIFEDYQSSYDDKKGKIVESDLWGGDAVEFRYCPDEDDTSIVKAETLRLWKWLYSVDAARPGYNEVLISNVERVENENTITYTLNTTIPYNDNFSIVDITPNFLFNIVSEGSIQTFSKYSISKFISTYVGSVDDYIRYIPYYVDDVVSYQIEITLPKENIIYENFDGWTPKFFITFTSKYVLNWTSDTTFEESNVEDTASYRNNKFKEEYDDYFEEDSLLYFYLFTERFTMIDNRAKNTFIHFDGLKWNYCFDYDNDTALGCNNRGYLTMDYGVEDIDNADGYPFSTHGGDPAFNASDSVLWVNVRNNLYTELQQAYNKGSLAWSSASMNNDFEKYQGYKCNWLQMIDMRRKYLRPFTYGHGPSTKTKVYEEKYLPMLQGRKTLQRRRYQKYQETYFESKYTSTTTHNQFTFRAAFTEIGPVIIPYIKCYPIIDWDDAPPYTQRTWPGEEYRTPKREIENDLNFTIYPAQHISAVNGLNNAGVKSASMGNGIKLTDINLSDNPNLPSGENAKIELSDKQTLLTVLNLKNTGATIVPSLSDLTNIRSLNTEDTKVTSIIFANGALIEEAHLGAFTELLSCVNNNNLEILTIQTNDDGKYNLKEVTLNNPSEFINWVDLINLSLYPVLNKITILNVDYQTNNCWSFDDNTWIEQLYNKDGAILSGNIYIDAIREPDYRKYLDKWPGLEIQYNVEAGFIPTYIVSYYNDDTKSQLLFTEVYDMDEVAVKPDYIPVKESDAEYNYEFKQWNIESLSGFYAFNTDTDVYAIYTHSPRMYNIKWMSDGNVISEGEYGYGSSVEYTGDESHLQPKQQRSGSWKLFAGWDNSTALITEDLTVTALWESGDYKQYTIDSKGKEFINNFDTRTLNAAQIYSIIKDDSHMDLFGEVNKDNLVISNNDRVRIQLGNTLAKYKNRTGADIYTQIITEPKVFTGNINDIISIENFMDDIDRPWTLIVDAQFIEAYNDSMLVSCYDRQSKSGFNIKNMIANTSDRTNDYSVLECFGNNVKLNTNKGFTREIYIIVHPGREIKNDNGIITQSKGDLIVYTGNLDNKDPFMTHVRFTGEKWSHNKPLLLGGYYNTQNRLTGAQGIIHSCEILNIALGEEECKELAMWPKELAEFTIVDFANLFKDDGNTVSLSFVAAQSTLAQISCAVAGKDKDNTTPYGFHDSFMSEWLNYRFLKALPITWRNMLANAAVPSSYFNGREYILQTSRYAKLWIPSLREINQSSDKEPWKSEGEPINLMTGDVWNRYFTPGCPMYNIYSATAEGQWVFTQSTDPRSEGKEIVQGAIWNKDSNNFFINYYGFWMKIGTTVTNIQSSNIYPRYATRSTAEGNNNYFTDYWMYSNTGGSVISSSGVNSRYLVPCFSI